MMLVRYLRAPCCPLALARRIFQPIHIQREEKFNTSAPSFLPGSGKVAKKFPLPLDFHNRSHTSSARTQKSAPSPAPRRRVKSSIGFEMENVFQKVFDSRRRRCHRSERCPPCVNGCLSPYNTIWVYLSPILPLLLDAVSQQHGRRGVR